MSLASEDPARRLARRTVLAARALPALAVLAIGAAAAQPEPAPQNRAAAALQDTADARLRLHSDPPPLAARFGITIVTSTTGGAEAPPPRTTQWHLYRDASRIALLKGHIDETWSRDPGGRIAFERTLHEERCILEYSPGELATLGVQADWSALSRFIDPRELRSLEIVSRSGEGSSERVRLVGRAGSPASLVVDWLPALQLPGRIVRHGQGGGVTRIELEEWGASAPPGWPLPGAQSAAYGRIDAADFGDMTDEPAVRKSEALDWRGGWRSPHPSH